MVGVVQWIECWIVNQKVAGLILGMCLGCRPGPSQGLVRGNGSMFLFTHSM